MFNHRDADYVQKMLKFTSEVDVIIEMAAHANLGKDLEILTKGEFTR